MTPQGWIRVVDALAIGEWHDNEHGSSHTRPPTDFDADHLLVRMVECIQGQVQVEIVCEPMLDYGATPAEWKRWSSRRRRRADAHDALEMDASDGSDDVQAVQRHPHGHRGQPHARAPHDGRRRETLLRDLLDGVAGRPAHRRAGRADPRADRPFLARLAGRRHLSRPSMARAPAALGARAEGADVHAHRRARRRADDLAAGDASAASATGTTATAGCATPRSRCGRCTRSASTGRRTTSSSTSLKSRATRTARCRSCTAIRGEKDLEESTLDHLKGYEGARPVRVGNGAYNQRQNDVFGAVLDSVYLHSKQRDHIPERLWPVLIDQVQCAAGRVEGARPGDLGGARRAAALRLLEADVLGRAGPRRAAGRTARPRGVTPKEFQAIADEIREDILERRASTSAASFASTTTPTRWTRRRCSCRCCASCRRTTSACARRCWRSATS